MPQSEARAYFRRHARLYAGHPRVLLNLPQEGLGWPEQSPAMTTADGGFVKAIVITLAIIACSVPAHAQTCPAVLSFCATSIRPSSRTSAMPGRIISSAGHSGGMTLPNA